MDTVRILTSMTFTESFAPERLRLRQPVGLARKMVVVGDKRNGVRSNSAFPSNGKHHSGFWEKRQPIRSSTWTTMEGRELKGGAIIIQRIINGGGKILIVFYNWSVRKKKRFCRNERMAGGDGQVLELSLQPLTYKTVLSLPHETAFATFSSWPF